MQQHRVLDSFCRDDLSRRIEGFEEVARLSKNSWSSPTRIHLISGHFMFKIRARGSRVSYSTRTFVQSGILPVALVISIAPFLSGDLRLSGGRSAVVVFPGCVRRRSISLLGPPDRCANVQIYTFGRRGNEFFQLLRVYGAARVLDIQSIHIRAGFMLINPTLKSRSGIRIIPDDGLTCPRRRGCRRGRHWHGFSCLGDFDLLYHFADLQPLLLGLFKRPSVTNDTLVIHVRGGDQLSVLSASNNLYGQPPCYYYLTVMAAFNKTMMCTEGMSPDGRFNPCHNISVAAGAVWTQGGLRDDRGLMIYAPNLVLSVSTLAMMAVWLCPFRKRFWTFDNYWQIKNVVGPHPRGRFPLFGDHMNCVAPKAYVAKVLQHWRGTDRQYARMALGNCIFVKVPGLAPEDRPFAKIRRGF
jgi:hypothetical protein